MPNSPRKPVDWTNVVAGLLIAIMPILAGKQVMEYAISRLEIESEATRKQIETVGASLKREIERVDMNSMERRSESREEMLQLHGLQAREIDANRQDIRDLRGIAR